MKKPSITDVAQASGVSIATVSRFINQSAGIKVSTGQRIMKAIHDLKYPLPEGFAVPVDKKNSNLILINIPTVANPFYNDVIKGIQDAAMRHGFYTLINVQHINPATADIFF